MTEREIEARAMAQAALALSVPVINMTAPLIPMAGVEGMFSFVDHLREVAKVIEAAARAINGTEIDDVIERSNHV